MVELGGWLCVVGLLGVVGWLEDELAAGGDAPGGGGGAAAATVAAVRFALVDAACWWTALAACVGLACAVVGCRGDCVGPGAE